MTKALEKELLLLIKNWELELQNVPEINRAKSFINPFKLGQRIAPELQSEGAERIIEGFRIQFRLKKQNANKESFNKLFNKIYRRDAAKLIYHPIAIWFTVVTQIVFLFPMWVLALILDFPHRTPLILELIFMQGIYFFVYCSSCQLFNSLLRRKVFLQAGIQDLFDVN